MQIFQDPSAMMQQLLTMQRPLTLGSYKHETDCEYTLIIVVIVISKILGANHIEDTKMMSYLHDVLVT